MAREILTALETLKNLKKRAEQRAQEMMEEICELEDYAKRLEPIIDLVEKMPELGETLLSSVQPPREKKSHSTVGSIATKEKIYAVLREKQLTITEIAREIDMSPSHVSTTVTEDVDRGILEKYKRFDQRLAIRICDKDVMRAQIPDKED